MREGLIQILCSGLGTCAFALFFRVHPRHLPMATLGGAASWLIYLLVMAWDGGIFLSTAAAALVVCLWSETMARLRKAPANTFLLPGIVPLLPGGALYYTMSALITQDMGRFLQKGQETILMALGIAAGILVASEVTRIFLWADRRRRRRNRRLAK